MGGQSQIFHTPIITTTVSAHAVSLPPKADPPLWPPRRLYSLTSSSHKGQGEATGNYLRQHPPKLRWDCESGEKLCAVLCLRFCLFVYVCAHAHTCAHAAEHKGQHFHFPFWVGVMLLQNGGQRFRGFHKCSIRHSDICHRLLSASAPIWINYSHLSESTCLPLIDMFIFQWVQRENMCINHHDMKWKKRCHEKYCNKQKNCIINNYDVCLLQCGTPVSRGERLFFSKLIVIIQKAKIKYMTHQIHLLTEYTP